MGSIEPKSEICKMQMTKCNQTIVMCQYHGPSPTARSTLPADPMPHQHQHSHASVKPLLTHSEYHKAHKLSNYSTEAEPTQRRIQKTGWRARVELQNCTARSGAGECPILERRAFPQQHSHNRSFTAQQEHPFKDNTPQ